MEVLHEIPFDVNVGDLREPLRIEAASELGRQYGAMVAAAWQTVLLDPPL